MISFSNTFPTFSPFSTWHDAVAPKPRMQQLVAKEYNALAHFYDKRWTKYTNATLRHTMDKFPSLPENAVLVDLACGTGALAETLAGQHTASRSLSKYIGLDISQEMLNKAVSKAAELDASFETEWILGAADKRIGLADGIADVVVTTNALHYFDDAAGMVAEVARVLKPGGVFVCADWCGDYITCRLLEGWLWLKGSPVHHVFKSAEADQLVSAAKLRSVSSDKKLLLYFWGHMVITAQKAI